MPRYPRRFNRREIRPVWVIACEDSVSVPCYIRAIEKIISPGIAIRFSSHRSNETNPSQVVQRAIESASQLEGKTPQDRIWAVFDTDQQAGRARRKDIELAIQNAAEAGVKLLISNPSFDHWLRLHLQDCDGAFDSGRKAFDALRQEWRDQFGSEYKKASADYDRIAKHEFVNGAVARAKSQHRRKGTGLPSSCRPCSTNFYEFVVAMLEVAN